MPTLASYIPEYKEHRETLASTGAKRASTVEKVVVIPKRTF